MTEIVCWFILLLPVAAAVLIQLGVRRRPRLSAGLSIAAVGVGFALSLGLFFGFDGTPWQGDWQWLAVGDLEVALGFRLDALSLLMLLVVTGVGGLIHVYSLGYMEGDPRRANYFAGLSLFTFAMTGIVFSTNFVELFIFWELVGLASYLLIGYWYERPAAADAGKKALLTNRLGDFGFLLGILLIWGRAGTLDFQELEARVAGDPAILTGVAAMAGLLIFCGAAGKSAQFPLHVWLPDAMEGPTPVSALIHAATMVAAGVYMLCRIHFLLDPTAMWVIGWAGAITACLAAVLALQEDDIKRILAYSTLSQLGYMVMAVGIGAPIAAMYHLATHAFFKALLFLGAGSIIVALHHEQNIWRMGGLRRRMPVTFWTFLLGSAALCGIPPLSGFYSKDRILAAALENDAVTWFIIGTLVAALTALYMFRLVCVVFGGTARSGPEDSAHEPGRVMTVPMIVLAIFAVVGGWFGIPEFLESGWLGGGEQISEAPWLRLAEPFNLSPLAAFLGLFAAVVGIFAAVRLYGGGPGRDSFTRTAPTLAWVLKRRLFIDDFYELVIAATQGVAARLAHGMDRWVLSGGIIRGVQGSVDLAGRLLRLLQTGGLQAYAVIFFLGVVLVVWIAMTR